MRKFLFTTAAILTISAPAIANSILTDDGTVWVIQHVKQQNCVPVNRLVPSYRSPEDVLDDLDKEYTERDDVPASMQGHMRAFDIGDQIFMFYDSITSCRKIIQFMER